VCCHKCCCVVLQHGVAVCVAVRIAVCVAVLVAVGVAVGVAMICVVDVTVCCSLWQCVVQTCGSAKALHKFLLDERTSNLISSLLITPPLDAQHNLI